MAFRLNESALAVFAQDHRIESVPQGSRLTRSLADRLAVPLTGPTTNLALRRFLGNLRRYTDKRFTTPRHQ